MLLNMIAGNQLEMEVLYGAYAGVNYTRMLKIPITVKPLMITFKITVGSDTRLCTYYRAKPTDSFTLRAGGRTPVSCTLYAEEDTRIMALVTDATAFNAADIEYYILGVKK